MKRIKLPYFASVVLEISVGYNLHRKVAKRDPVHGTFVERPREVDESIVGRQTDVAFG